jgi:hypothetical protein
LGLNEDRRQRERRAHVGHEAGRHDEFADPRLVEPGLHQHRVDDGQRRRREGGAGDQRCLHAPVEQPVGDERGDNERADEGHQSDPDRRAEALAKVVGVDLGTSQERQHDRRELRDEHQPVRIRIQAEGIAGDHPETELEQGHRDPQLDRQHAGEDNGGGENCGELDWLHLGSTKRRRLLRRGHQRLEAAVIERASSLDVRA